MTEYRREDLPFDPEIGIGFFGTGPHDHLAPQAVELDREAYETALARARRLGVDTWRRVETLTVVSLDPSTGVVENLAQIGLGGADDGEGDSAGTGD
jgi:hypothetical protein